MSLLLFGWQQAHAEVRETVEAYLRAGAAKDLEALYALDHDEQEKNAQIRTSRPKRRWEKLISRNRAAYLERKTQEAAFRPEVERLLALQPQVEILEIQTAEPTFPDLETPPAMVAVVFLRYSDPLASPIVGSALAGPYHLRGLLEAAIVAIYVDAATELVVSARAIERAIWADPPLQVVSISYSGAGQMDLYTVGGTPPSSATVQCGDHVATASVSDRRGRNLAASLAVSEGVCTVRAKDAKGRTDSVVLRLQQREEPGNDWERLAGTVFLDWYGREPWLSAGFGDVLFGTPLRSISALEPE